MTVVQAIHEPCPPELESQDFPEYGGMLCFNEPENLVAHCPVCDWRGMPTIRNGIISSFCPACRPMAQVNYGDLSNFGKPESITAQRVSRNAPCPCGSGMKAKRCECDAYAV